MPTTVEIVPVVMGHFPDRVVAVLGDKQVAARIDGDADRIVQRGDRGATTVARVANGRAAGHRRDYAARQIHRAHAIVLRIGNQQVAVDVERQSGGSVELGRRGETAIAPIAASAGAGHGAEQARGMIYFTHNVATRIGNEQIAAGIDRNGLR